MHNNSFTTYLFILSIYVDKNIDILSLIVGAYPMAENKCLIKKVSIYYKLY